MSGPKHTNRLSRETSPYLLQHAHNPVDWHPWGPEAFEKSRRENKPIFLSVGYSTCYWCHVMERQCFENEQIAAQMNEHFVCIKVDREERPDVDQVYMTAVQVLTRQGGWPMSVFLTPDLKPFYGGTYFPPTDAYGRPGFPRILAAIDEAWRNRPKEVGTSADQVVGILKQLAEPTPATQAFTIDAQWIAVMVEHATQDFDPVHGGFGSAPKFPRETLLEFLLVFLRGQNNEAVMHQVRSTLDAMAMGGIRDQLGGGFHRYSTDEMWLVPHFEIMLYDNAMLLWIYAEAYAQTHEARYAEVARGIAEFILREMTSPAGTFYTALDAEVDAREGGNYLWTLEEVESALKDGATKEQIERFCRVYGLAAGPNFADPHQGHGAPDKNVLYLTEPEAILDAELAKLRGILYAARQQRKGPMLDTKILTSWNALMIRGLAHAGKILGEPRYLAAAAKAADVLWDKPLNTNGVMLDDFAFLIQALLELEEAGENKIIRRSQAMMLTSIMVYRFADAARGGFYFTDEKTKDVIVRQKIGSDSPLPSGNGVAAMNLTAVGQPELAMRTIRVFAGAMEAGGDGMGAMLQATMNFVRLHGPLRIEAGAVEAADRPLSPGELAAKVVSVRTRWLDDTHLEIGCTVLAGFHILADRLVIGGKEREIEIDLPPGTSRKLAFDEQPVDVYEGEFAIGARLPTRPEKAVELTLTYQACDDSACLPQATQRIEAGLP